MLPQKCMFPRIIYDHVCMTGSAWLFCHLTIILKTMSVALCHIIVFVALWFKLVLLALKIPFKEGFYLYVLT